MPGKDGGYRLPSNIHPPTFCMTLEVPDDPEYIASLAGALWELQFWWNWERNNAHTAREVTAVWRKLIQAAFDRINAGHLCPVPSFVNIAEMEYEMSICEQLRFHDGKLQGLCCGEWSDISGQGGIDIGGPGQQGDGAPQPPPGSCQTYHAQFTAKDTYLLPTVVNAGDVLTFSNAMGAGNDGNLFPAFRCPDGGTFFAGACLPIYSTDGADPNPAIHHMALVAKIGAVYYPAFDGVVTVPGGIVNEQVFILVNDSTRTDNNGSYSLDIEVCNNGVASWTHDVNLKLSPSGFAQISGFGLWTAGSGWSPTDEIAGGGGTSVRRLWVAHYHAVTHYTAISINYNMTRGADPSAAPLPAAILTYDAGHSDALYKNNLVTNGSGLTLGDTVAVDAYGVGLFMTCDYEPGGTGLGGSGLVYTLHVEGTGFDPWA